ncbi:hypothetical protein GCM10028807_55340 [Spirosoma daeguense]
MQKKITLGEAANELHVFYLDLLLLMQHAGYPVHEEAPPERLIPYEYITVLKRDFAEYLPPEHLFVGKRGIDRYIYEEEIRDKYKDWLFNWIEKNRATYPTLLYSYRYRMQGLALIEPTSYEDFCAGLMAYSNGNLPLISSILSHGIEFKLFEFYSEFRVSGRYYNRLDMIDSDSFRRRSNLPVIPYLQVQQIKEYYPAKRHNGKPTKQWAYYYAFLNAEKKFSTNPYTSVLDFFLNTGRTHSFDGRHIMQQYNKIKAKLDRDKAMQKRGAYEFVQLAIKLLKQNGYPEIAKKAQEEYDEASKLK